MANQGEQTQLDKLLSIEAIRNLVSQYCHAADRGDIELMYSLYEEDAIDEHGYNTTGTAKEFIEGIEPLQQHIDGLQHNVTNHVIHVNGDQAEGQVYVVAYHRFETETGPAILMTGGRYLDKYSRKNGIWKIAHRRCISDWNHQFPIDMNAEQKDYTEGKISQGKIGAEDPAYDFFQWIQRGKRCGL